MPDEDRILDSMLRDDPGQVVIFGDFACPWSFLASQRAGVLEASGVKVVWRAVEGCRHPWEVRASRQRLDQVREAIPEVQAASVRGRSSRRRSHAIRRSPRQPYRRLPKAPLPSAARSSVGCCSTRCGYMAST